MRTDSLASGTRLELTLALSFLCACTPAAPPRLEVLRNPYAKVDWKRTLQLKTQLHEHVADIPEAIRHMDDAGYDIVPIFQYSGKRSRPMAWRERHWPPEKYLPPGFAAEMKHIKLFFPDAEEVGAFHVTSPFLTTYIEKWEPRDGVPKREKWHYTNTQEAIDLIRNYGGLPFIAHPWSKPSTFTKLTGFTGMEVYNAYCRHKFQIGEKKKDKNSALVKSWDAVLMDRPATVAIAVNDWFGPGTITEGVAPDTLDSGKVLTLMPSVSLANLRTALATGTLFAVKDLGQVKDQYPRVRSIKVDHDKIQIMLASEGASIHWIVDGKRAHGKRFTFPLAQLAPGARFVRAEIIADDGSTVYTQAFAVGEPEPKGMFAIAGRRLRAAKQWLQQKLGL